jgi:hypothetical protein
MKWILILGAALLVLRLLGPVVRLVIAAFGGKAIGEAALRQQPDNITLERGGPNPWRLADQAAATYSEFHGLGYTDAGIWLVKEMPGVIVRLMANPRENLFAALYEHPQVGQWFDVGRFYQDGSSSSWTTARDMGLEKRPGHPMVHVTGQSPAQVHAQAVAERSAKWPKPVRVEDCVQEFERAYAESTAWRKQNGISRREVVRVATRKVA